MDLRFEPSFSSLTGFSATLSSSALNKKFSRNFGSSKAIASPVPTSTVPTAYTPVRGARAVLAAVESCLAPVLREVRILDDMV